MISIKKRITAVVLIIFISNVGITQEEARVWTGYSVRSKISKELRITAGQLFMFGQEPFELASLQNSINARYRLNKRMYVDMGYIRSSSIDDPDQEARNRISSRFRLNSRLGKWRLANSLRAEWHFPERSKFEYRLRYGFRLHRGDWGMPLKITPYINNEFHYYLSGRPLQYRDPSGDKVIKQSPDGLHAYRFTLGIGFRPFKRARAGISYMVQREFNVGNKYREINVVDPRDGDINRTFNNFSVLQFRFGYQIDFRSRSSGTSSKNINSNKATSTW